MTATATSPYLARSSVPAIEPPACQPASRMNVTQVFQIPSPAFPRRCVRLLILLHVLAAIPAAGMGGNAPATQDSQGVHLPPQATPAPPPRLPWLAAGDTQARLALGLLRRAAAHGLDPGHYGVEALERRLAGLRTPAEAAAFEQDLGTAMVRFVADLHFGRTASAYRSPADTAGRLDPAAYVRAALSEGRLEQAVEAAAPAIPLYRRVQATLAHYGELARVNPDWGPLPPVAAGLAAGRPYEGAVLLRERLQLLGDLDAAALAPGEEQLYTAELAAGLRRFQSRHGLAEDGVLGRETLAALSVPLANRVAQLRLTLERLRWLPPLPGGRIVAVNLPTYRLWAFDTRNDPSVPPLEMRIIVGTAARTPTPLFIGQMRYLELNPFWNVPRSIAVGEIAPKLARNPAYLEQNDMELVSAGGKVLPAATTGALDSLRAGKARIRQRPGAANALGTVKFAMPNPMNIYLHSTSSRELFNRTRRDLSHGCIRVEFPVELAQFVLADPEQWNEKALDAAIRSGRTRTLSLPTPVPVVLFYATAVTDRHGRALFAADIYGRDAALLEALHKR